MTREDIIDMAAQAGINEATWFYDDDVLEKFATLVAAAERNKPWINLTDEEIEKLDDELSAAIVDRTYAGWWDAYDTLGFARLIEQKLKEKNNG